MSSQALAGWRLSRQSEMDRSATTASFPGSTLGLVGRRLVAP